MMKNFKAILSFLIFSFVLTGVGLSQGLGFKAGLNLANVKFDPNIESSTDAKLGFQVGAFYELNAGKTIVIRPGLSYSAKGTNESGGDGLFSLGYIDVPVDVVYKFDVGTNKIAINAGPYLGLLLIASDEDGEDIEEMFKGTDFGLNIGAAYEISNIIVGLNYGFGLSNILDDPDAPENQTVKNTNISITVGYRL
jgi:hypothetical protein